MDPMPSGGRKVNRRDAEARRGCVCNVRACDAIGKGVMARALLAQGTHGGGAGPAAAFTGAVSRRLCVSAVGPCKARRRFRAMDPMPSGRTRLGQNGAGAAELGAGGAAQGHDFGRAGTVLPAGVAAAGETGGRARSGAEAAMEAAAAVGHGGLAAGAAAAGVGAATGRGQEIAGRVAVLQPAAPGEREARAERRRIRAINMG